MGLIGNDKLNDLFINSPLQAPQAIIIFLALIFSLSNSIKFFLIFFFFYTIDV